MIEKIKLTIGIAQLFILYLLFRIGIMIMSLIFTPKQNRLFL